MSLEMSSMRSIYSTKPIRRILSLFSCLFGICQDEGQFSCVWMLMRSGCHVWKDGGETEDNPNITVNPLRWLNISIQKVDQHRTP